MKSVLPIMLLFAFAFSSYNALGQQYASTRVKDRYQAYTDSLKQVEYDYLFLYGVNKPIKKGLTFPIPPD